MFPFLALYLAFDGPKSGCEAYNPAQGSIRLSSLTAWLKQLDGEARAANLVADAKYQICNFSVIRMLHLHLESGKKTPIMCLCNISQEVTS
jgi:hypothetical protein